MSHPDYSPMVWQYFNDDRRAGAWPLAEDVIAVRANTPGSRAVMAVQIKLIADQVADARFQVYGCVSAIACGAWLADWLVGKDQAQLAELTANDIDAALALAPVKRHCALLAEDALGMLRSGWCQNNEVGPSTQKLEARG